MSLRVFHLFHPDPHLRISCCVIPYFLLLGFLHRYPISRRVPVYCCLIAKHLPPSIYRSRDKLIYKVSSHPDMPYLFDYDSGGQDFHICHCAPANLRGLFLLQSCHSIRSSILHLNLHVLFHYVLNFQERSLMLFQLCRLH